MHGKVEGTLTLKGIARHEVFSLTLGGADIDRFGKYRVGFEARTEINRRDYDVMFQTVLESGGVLVSDNVTIVIDGSIVYRDPEPEAGEF
ncbi:YceI family protein [Corynebacterium suedekumii]|nr:YceI family protein [Corynebacterium suedekumii]